MAALAAAGMVCVGKTNLSELAFSGLGTNPHFGTPPNPRAPGRVPGGSSSGSAVAVAAGIVPVAIGTDTAGSIRVPAAFCRIAGFKPSAARIDRTGLLPLAPTLDSIGPLATCVADLIAVDAALRGAAARAQRRRRRGERRRRRCGSSSPRASSPTTSSPSVAARFAADLDALAAAGARMQRRPLAALDRARALLAEHGGMVAHEAWRGHVALLDSLDADGRDGAQRERLDPPVLRRLREGRALPAAGYDALVRERPGVQAALADELAGALVALPAVAARAARDRAAARRRRPVPRRQRAHAADDAAAQLPRRARRHAPRPGSCSAARAAPTTACWRRARVEPPMGRPVHRLGQQEVRVAELVPAVAARHGGRVGALDQRRGRRPPRAAAGGWRRARASP